MVEKSRFLAIIFSALCLLALTPTNSTAHGLSLSCACEQAHHHQLQQVRILLDLFNTYFLPLVEY
jgi:hypothetical protein